MTDAQICQLIFEYGLTTNQDTNQIAGRGVGLYALKMQVESIGGTIFVVSSQGAGTKFIINLPIITK